jgi:hypothetical protein
VHLHLSHGLFDVLRTLNDRWNGRLSMVAVLLASARYVACFNGTLLCMATKRTIIKLGNTRRPKAHESMVAVTFIVPDNKDQQLRFFSALAKFFLDSGQSSVLRQIYDAVHTRQDQLAAERLNAAS